jgi:hypothetical protein
MDGSVSTLAPIFAAAGLTERPFSAFFVGLAASLGAAISMGSQRPYLTTGARVAAVRSIGARLPVSQLGSAACCTGP